MLRDTAGNEVVLVIGAHPDDEVLGAGGTMAKHASAGDEVHALIITEGASQQYDDDLIDQKESEAQACARALGIESVRFGRLPDMRLDEVAHVDVNELIEQVIEDLEPHVVYTHSRSEVNLDHGAVHESTMVATRPPSGVEAVLTYEVPSSTDWVGGSRRSFSPNVYVDVTDHIDTKVNAFLEYESERREYPHPRSERAIRARAEVRGSESGFQSAEAFSLIKSYQRDL